MVVHAALVATIPIVAFAACVCFWAVTGYDIGGERLVGVGAMVAAVAGAVFAAMLASMRMGWGSGRARGPAEEAATARAGSRGGGGGGGGHVRWSPPQRQRRSLPGLLCLGMVLMAGVPTAATTLYYTGNGGDFWELFPYTPAMWIAPAAVLAFKYGGEARLRRLEDATDCMLAIGASVPRRTEADTLVALREVRDLRAGAAGMAAGLGERGRNLAGVLDRAASWIDGACDAEVGSQGGGEAGAADFARTTQALGREIDDASPHWWFWGQAGRPG